MLRKKGVVDKFVEFFGPGLDSMSLPDRATIANMAPEYGATMGFFPVDEETLRYMRLTGRPEEVDRADRSLLPRAGTVPRTRARPTLNSPTRSNWTWVALCPPWQVPNARRIVWRCSDMKIGLPESTDRPGQGARLRTQARRRCSARDRRHQRRLATR